MTPPDANQFLGSPTLLATIRRLRLNKNWLSEGALLGTYRSHFRGIGLEFDTVREYQPGDDLRFVDWRVSARRNAPYIRCYREERNLNLLLALDTSASLQEGGYARKWELALQLATLIALCGAHAGDRVGAMRWSDKIDEELPARRGLPATLKLLYRLLRALPDGPQTSLRPLCAQLRRERGERKTVFIISDFIAPLPPLEELTVAAKHHHILALHLDTPLERKLPHCGLIRLYDAEQGCERLVDSNDRMLRTALRNRFSAIWEEQAAQLKRAGVRAATISTTERPEIALERFFRASTQAKRGITWR